jgi:hypothetical protein
MQRREVATKVSGQSLGTIFKDQAVQDWLSRNVGNKLKICAT